MDISAKKLARLMRADQPVEVRGSAVVVAAELGVKDADIAGEVIDRLSDESDAVRIQAIKAAGKLKLTKALPLLLERVTLGGEEAKLSAEAAAKLGADAVRKLQDLMNTVSPGLRRVVAVALTGAGGAGAEAGVAVLLDKDPQVAAASASAMVGRIPTMPAEQKAKLVPELVALLADKKAKLATASELSLIKVLASLNDPAAADVVWDRTLPPYPPEVRAAALQVIGGWLPASPTKEQFRRLFAAASETSFNIVAPALMALNKLAVTDKMLAEWARLFDAPDMAARRLALEKLGDRDTPEVADAIMAQMNHHDRNIGELARKKLSKLEHGRERLGGAILEATTGRRGVAARPVGGVVRRRLPGQAAGGDLRPRRQVGRIRGRARRPAVVPAPRDRRPRAPRPPLRAGRDAAEEEELRRGAQVPQGADPRPRRRVPDPPRSGAVRPQEVGQGDRRLVAGPTTPACGSSSRPSAATPPRRSASSKKRSGSTRRICSTWASTSSSGWASRRSSARASCGWWPRRPGRRRPRRRRTS